ncbi:hypothetical protein X798_04052 [Onchocerca flexuosa]|uniref:Uncharacterized protein n=1 Tax=Onchocerca flexuosa TaxID=387005 RepID=A0A238BW63_9BILA|nr:hypothetical protein X798_04052 [Onchocerca flexuosa]
MRGDKAGEVSHLPLGDTNFIGICIVLLVTTNH